MVVFNSVRYHDDENYPIVSNIEITEGQADKLNGLADWQCYLDFISKIYVVVVVVSLKRCCDSTTEFWR